jgi:hypothetical protein
MYAWTIDYGYSVSDSFTLNSGATVTEVNFGVWLLPGDSITGVDWSIGTVPFGSSVGSGTGASVSSTLVGTIWDYYSVVSATFSFSDLNLATGTYYLTLQNAVVTDGDPAYWDINDAPGIDAWENSLGNVSASGACSEDTDGYASGTCASSFQILGTTAAVPEPATWTLLGSGILAAFALRRKAIGR